LLCYKICLVFRLVGFGLSATTELSDGEDLLEVKQRLTNSLNKMLDFEIQKIKLEGSE